MPKRTEYAQGTPDWVELQTTDPSAAKKFYASLFGWSYQDKPMPQAGVYSMAMLNGDTVAAVAAMPPGAPDGVPPMWNTYLAVDDVDAAAEKAGRAGGQLLMPPTDIGEAGRMAFVADPTGAVVGLWQANKHIGATVVGDTGAVVWNELVTDKPESALPFYQRRRHGGGGGGDGAGPALQPAQSRRDRRRRMCRAAGCRRAEPLACVLRGRRCGCDSGPGDFGGRTGRRCAVRHPHRGTVRRVERSAGRDVQRADAVAAVADI